MAVKTSSTWITTDSDEAFANDIAAALAGIAANPIIYDKPNPPLADVQAGLDAFTGGVQAWKVAGGGKALTAKKRNLRAALAVQVRDLCSYVQVACKGNMEWLQLSGIPAQKPIHTPVGPVATPVAPVLSLGDYSGQLDASVTPVFGAVLYSWRLTASTPNATPVVTQTTAARTTLTGLTPAMAYKVEANAIGSAGPSDWSDAATQIVV
jgi:hypothetical protein